MIPTNLKKIQLMGIRKIKTIEIANLSNKKFGCIEKTNGEIVFVFEYLSSLKDPCLIPFILQEGIEAQVKIKNSFFSDVAEILENKIFNNPKEKIKKEVLDGYRADNGSFYRHFIIVKSKDIKELITINDKLLNYCKKNLINIYRLNQEDIFNYLFQEINFPKTSLENVSSLNISEEKELDIKPTDILNPLKALYNLIEYWSGKIGEKMDSNLKQSTTANVMKLNRLKWILSDDFIQIDDNYKGGLVYQGIQGNYYNILSSIMCGGAMENGDSFIISFSPYIKETFSNEYEQLAGKSKEEEKFLNLYNLSFYIMINAFRKEDLNDKRESIQSRTPALMSKQIVGKPKGLIPSLLGIGEDKIANSLEMKRSDIISLIKA